MRIRDLAVGVYDGPHATPPLASDGPIYLGIGNITEDGHLDLSSVRHIAESDFAHWTKRVTPRADDIVFTYEATLNRYAIIPEGFRGCLGRRTALIRPDTNKVDPRFLFYSFFGKEWRDTIEANRLSGATVDRIPIATFPDFPIRVPPLADQRRISSILRAYDDLIEVNRRRTALLEEIARRLFEEWFFHFRLPGDADSPDDWYRGTIGDGVRFIRGRSYRSLELSHTGGLPFVNLKCVKRDGGFRRDGLKRFTGDYKPEQVLRPGDVVMAVTDMTQERRIVGQAAMIPRMDEPLAVLSMDLVKVEPTNRTRLLFLYFWLRFSGFSKVAAQHANGANVLHLSPKALFGLPMLVPPIALQDAFCRIAAPIVAQADALAATEDRLTASRDLLLPRLISGELSVASAERDAEAAA
jgi:type I restriction enzyme S subunit